jgi:hypothetical protein
VKNKKTMQRSRIPDKQEKPQVIVEDLNQPAFINKFSRYIDQKSFDQSSISFDLQKKTQQRRNNAVNDNLLMPYHRDINDDDFLIRESK